MFEYLCQKIAAADVQTGPFKHIHIDNFFSAEQFAALIEQPEIRLSPAANDQELISILHDADYKEIHFPGTTTDLATYLAWHGDKCGKPLGDVLRNPDLCEGVGVTFRLQAARSALVGSLMDFLQSSAWLDAVAAKFGIVGDFRADGGIQKYLDGYEISPHPDTRRKALTYMVNINPDQDADNKCHHTHYMKFTKDRAYVQAFWQGNQDIDRCWVPWSWCETVKTQTANNSIVVFQPSDDTMHAVRADYDHLPTQRTQIYGNFWYNLPPKKKGGAQSSAQWTGLDLRARFLPA